MSVSQNFPQHPQDEIQETKASGGVYGIALNAPPFFADNVTLSN
jgi:hypothetical protein